MTSKSVTIVAGLGLSLLSSVSQAANVSTSGVILPSLQDRSGSTLPDGSIVQVGFLLGLPVGTDLTEPANIASIDWDSFTAITGVGSPNNTGDYDTRTSSIFGAGTFFGENLNFDDADPIFGGLPVRVAVRIFDSIDAIGNADFNTYTSSNDFFILESPDPLNPNAGRADFSINTEADPGLIWQGTPFQTSVAVPEASTSLSALLGLTLLLGARRRK